MLFILLSFLGILLQNVSANKSLCNAEGLRTCAADALEQMSALSGTDVLNQEELCRGLRDNFDCMLWQTSNCFKDEDHSRNSKVIAKTSKYLREYCAQYGKWWELPCFQDDGVKQCESKLPTDIYNVDESSCRMFVSFRDCVLSVTEDSCRSSDRRFLGIYFMDKGREMAWRCSKNSNVTSLSAENDHVLNQKYSVMYGDFSIASLCVLPVLDDLKTCVTKFKHAQEEAQKSGDNKETIRKVICCEVPNMKKCILDILEGACGSDAKIEGEKFFTTYLSDSLDKCKFFSFRSCSGANDIFPVNAAATCLLLYLVSFVYIKMMF